MSRNQTDVQTRLGELEATVRGLTQELVEANERIRQLEAAAEDAPRSAGSGGATTGGAACGDGSGDAEDRANESDTRQMGGDGEAGEEAGSELDDIIVA